MSDETELSVGDWVRFMRNGQLVIDEIVYVRPRGQRHRAYVPRDVYVTCAHGAIEPDDVLELRPR